MSEWAEQFKPISALGWDIRPQQEVLGNAIIHTVSNGGTLVAQAATGVGKSVSAAVPVITKIHEMRKLKKPYRAVISTETITLQTQLAEKDLPFLQGVYGGFTYCKLLGRSNYLCLNQAKENAIGNLGVEAVYQALMKYQGNIDSGEYENVQSCGAGFIDKIMWSKITGSSDYCGSNSCDPEFCWSARARAKALRSDIVVVSHALLAVDHTSKMNGVSNGGAEGMLGKYNALIVDEAHRLETVLSDQWTERVTLWELNDHAVRLTKGITAAQNFKSDPGMATAVEDTTSGFIQFFDNAMEFFYRMTVNRGDDWDGSQTAFSEKTLMSPDAFTTKLMEKYELYGPNQLQLVIEQMDRTQKYLMDVLVKIAESGQKSKLTKDIKKAYTSTVTVSKIASILMRSLSTKNGVISYGGTIYGVIADGYTKFKTGEKGMTIRCVPIDVSEKASGLWTNCDTNIMLSATLTDLTEGNFRYFLASLGLNADVQLDVPSPFTMLDQQLVYISDTRHPAEDGMVSSVEELVELVNIANGRTLVLFTSRREIDMVEQLLLQYKIAGRFNYTILTQTKDADKAKLVEEFKRDTHSVMLGLKSMFTGIDVPGESLSLVALMRFPNPRFDIETRMRVDYWRRASFPNWYAREALTVFQQAAGRLIRSKECVGVVALLDQRAYDGGTTVFKTASIGVNALGSRTTHDPVEVANHLRSVPIEV